MSNSCLTRVMMYCAVVLVYCGYQYDAVQSSSTAATSRGVPGSLKESSKGTAAGAAHVQAG